jgi:transglutaminase-like putative cysteine protease
VRFGLVHRIMTDALAALVSLVACLAIPESWQDKPWLKHFGNIAPVALCVIQGARLVLGRSPLDVAVEFAALLQIIRLGTRRGAAHDQQIIVLALMHLVAGTVLGGGLAYGICFLGFLVVAPGALVLSHLRREVEGNYRQGARDRTGHPVDVPRILRSRRVVGRGFLVSTCLLSIPIFIFTALLFVTFPRVGLSLLLLSHPHAGRMVGFSDKVDLGQVGVLRSDPSIALRFELAGRENPPPRLILRFRGTAFDKYNGKSWERTVKDKLVDATREGGSLDVYPIVRHADPAHDLTISINLEPIDPPVVFLPPHTISLHLTPVEPSMLSDRVKLQRGPEGEFRYDGSDGRGLRYEAFIGAEGESSAEIVRPVDQARYLEVPPDLPSRIGTLAHTWADRETTQQAKAHAIEEHLRKEYRYDINSPSSGTAQPVDDFLFSSKRGHCEFFSTAMAVMLREVGIPSRNVTGFVGGTYNRFGKYYAVREGDAHSWVEAYIGDQPRPHWTTFDPTPPAGAQPLEDTTGFFVYMRDAIEALSAKWSSVVVGYDLHTQIQLFEDMKSGYDSIRKKTGTNHGGLERWTRPSPLAAAGIMLAIAIAYVWRELQRRKRVADAEEDAPQQEGNALAATTLYRLLEAALSARGILRPASLPPLRHALELTRDDHPLAPEVLALTHVYLDSRFGGRTLTENDVRAFERRVKDVRQRPIEERNDPESPVSG